MGEMGAKINDTVQGIIGEFRASVDEGGRWRRRGEMGLGASGSPYADDTRLVRLLVPGKGEQDAHAQTFIDWGRADKSFWRVLLPVYNITTRPNPSATGLVCFY